MKPISSGSPPNGDRQRLARLADVLGLRGDGQLAVGEAQPQRRVALRHHRRRGGRRRAAPRAAARARARRPRAGAACSSGTARRCGASSAARRRSPKTTWFSCTPSSSSSPSWAIRASSPSARAGTIASSSGTVALERGLLHREPVRVGRGHHELAGLEAHEDPGQHRARLVARRGAADPRDRRRAASRGRPRAARPPRPRAAAGSPRRCRCAAGSSPSRESNLDRRLLGRCSIATSASGSSRTRSTSSRPGHDDRALVLDLRVERRPQRELHVGRRELELAACGAQQDAGEDLDGRPRRDAARDDRRVLGRARPADR